MCLKAVLATVRLGDVAVFEIRQRELVLGKVTNVDDKNYCLALFGGRN